MGLQGRTSKPIAVVSRSVVSRSRDIWYRTGIGLAPAAGLFCLEGQCSTHQRDRVEYASLRHTSTSLRLRLRTFDARPLTSSQLRETGLDGSRNDVATSNLHVRMMLVIRRFPSDVTWRVAVQRATDTSVQLKRHTQRTALRATASRWDKPSRPGRCPQEPGPRSPSSPQTQPRSEPVAIPHTPRHAVHPNPECYTS
jgi:hypothetical protein